MSGFDVIVVGGGVAGASAAAFLSQTRRVVLLERESHPGYHTSGRSAALFSETYGNAVVRGLSVGSRSFLEGPPQGFADHPILSPRGGLFIGRAEHLGEIASRAAEGSRLVPSVRAVDADEARRLVPILRPAVVAGGIHEPDAMDIDTHGLLHGFLKVLRGNGGRLVTDAEVEALERRADGWHVASKAGSFVAPVVVNAAGAWADVLARMAGAAPVGLVPKRRTAFMVEPPPGHDIRDWPITGTVEENFYFKPDAGMLLCSPEDETPSEPCDAQPEEIDIAVAVDRIQASADLPVHRIGRKWAGLRSFVADKTPVVGFDPKVDGFFWLAGQGGYGFQTAPAMARTAAALATDRPLPADLAALDVTQAALSPARFAA
jgi:D-arginine dehydrogenase